MKIHNREKVALIKIISLQRSAMHQNHHLGGQTQILWLLKKPVATDCDKSISKNQVTILF